MSWRSATSRWGPWAQTSSASRRPRKRLLRLEIRIEASPARHFLADALEIGARQRTAGRWKQFAIFNGDVPGIQPCELFGQIGHARGIRFAERTAFQPSRAQRIHFGVRTVGGGVIGLKLPY